MANLFETYDIQPIGNFVFLRRDDMKDRTEGGLVLPPSAQEKSLQAVVLAAGPGTVVGGGTFVPTTVKEGDLVLVDKIGGFEIEEGREKFLIVREPEIIAIIRPKGKL